MTIAQTYLQVVQKRFQSVKELGIKHLPKWKRHNCTGHTMKNPIVLQ